MGDMGDLYRDWKEHKKENKAKYHANGLPRELALLDNLEGVTYEVMKCGEFYKLTVLTDRGNHRRVDYWPSTALWKVKTEDGKRYGKAEGRGIHHLKRYFKLKLKGSENSVVSTKKLPRSVD